MKKPTGGRLVWAGLAWIVCTGAVVSDSAHAGTAAEKDSPGEMEESLHSQWQNQWYEDNLWGFPPWDYYRWRLQEGALSPLHLAGRMGGWVWNHSYGFLLHPFKHWLRPVLKECEDLAQYLGAPVTIFVVIVLFWWLSSVLSRLHDWLRPVPWAGTDNWRYRLHRRLAKPLRVFAVAHLFVWSSVWSIVFVYGIVYNIGLARPHFIGFHFGWDIILESDLAGSLMFWTLLLSLFAAAMVCFWVADWKHCKRWAGEQIPWRFWLRYPLWVSFFALAAHNPLSLDIGMGGVVMVPLFALFMLFVVGGKIINAVSDRI